MPPMLPQPGPTVAPESFFDKPQVMNTPWVESPFFRTLLESAAPDAEMRDLAVKYAKHGYVIIDPKIPSEILEGAAKDLEGRFKPTYEPYYADETRLQEGWFFSENIKKIAIAPRVLEILQFLYQRRPIPFQTLNFRVGSQQRTHSDTIHFDSIPQRFMCGVWLALEDIDARNGPLHYYSDSHKLPVFNMLDVKVIASNQKHPYDNYFTVYENFVEALMKAEEMERSELHVERGQALIWSANLFHGGTPIRDHGRTRFSQVTHYFFSDCLYYTPLLSDPALGVLAARKTLDVTTGAMVKQFYNGVEIENPGEWPPRLRGIPSPCLGPITMPPMPINTVQTSKSPQWRERIVEIARKLRGGLRRTVSGYNPRH